MRQRIKVKQVHGLPRNSCSRLTLRGCSPFEVTVSAGNRRNYRPPASWGNIIKPVDRQSPSKQQSLSDDQGNASQSSVTQTRLPVRAVGAPFRCYATFRRNPQTAARHERRTGGDFHRALQLPFADRGGRRAERVSL